MSFRKDFSIYFELSNSLLVRIFCLMFTSIL